MAPLTAELKAMTDVFEGIDRYIQIVKYSAEYSDIQLFRYSGAHGYSDNQMLSYSDVQLFKYLDTQIII